MQHYKLKITVFSLIQAQIILKRKKKVILCKITLGLQFLPIPNRWWWKKCCGDWWGWSEIGHENGSHGAVSEFQPLLSASWHLAFMDSLTSDFVCGGRQDVKGGIAICRFLCHCSLDLQVLAVDLRFGTVRVWCIRMKHSVMQENAVFPGPLPRVPVPWCYIAQCFCCTTGCSKRKPHAWLYKLLILSYCCWCFGNTGVLC